MQKTHAQRFILLIGGLFMFPEIAILTFSSTMCFTILHPPPLSLWSSKHEVEVGSFILRRGGNQISNY